MFWIKEAKIWTQGLVLHLYVGYGGSSPLLLICNAGCTLISLEPTIQSEHRTKIKARSWSEAVWRNFCLRPFFHNHSAKITALSQPSYDAEMCYLYMTPKYALKMPQGRDYGRLRAPVTNVFVSCEYIIQMHGVLDSKTLILSKPNP